MDWIFRPAARCVIVNKKNEVLLVSDDWIGWALPWWWIDFWENVEDAVRRESLEELWIEAEPERLLCMMDRKRMRKWVLTHLVVYIWSIKNSEDFENVEKTYYTASHAFESEEVKYFPVDELPTDLVPDWLDWVLKNYVKDRENYNGGYVSGL